MGKIAFEAIRIPYPTAPLAISVDDNLDKIADLGKEMVEPPDWVCFPASQQKFKVTKT